MDQKRIFPFPMYRVELYIPDISIGFTIIWYQNQILRILLSSTTLSTPTCVICVKCTATLDSQEKMKDFDIIFLSKLKRIFDTDKWWGPPDQHLELEDFTARSFSEAKLYFRLHFGRIFNGFRRTEGIASNFKKSNTKIVNNTNTKLKLNLQLLKTKQDKQKAKGSLI